MSGGLSSLSCAIIARALHDFHGRQRNRSVSARRLARLPRRLLPHRRHQREATNLRCEWFVPCGRSCERSRLLIKIVIRNGPEKPHQRTCRLTGVVNQLVVEKVNDALRRLGHSRRRRVVEQTTNARPAIHHVGETERAEAIGHRGKVSTPPTCVTRCTRTRSAALPGCTASSTTPRPRTKCQ